MTTAAGRLARDRATGRTVRPATPLPRRQETPASTGGRPTSAPRVHCAGRCDQARYRSRSSPAQRILPDQRPDVWKVLDHSDLARQFVELHDRLRVTLLERGRHVGALLEPPGEELGRQVVLRPDRTENFVPV